MRRHFECWYDGVKQKTKNTFSAIMEWQAMNAPPEREIYMVIRSRMKATVTRSMRIEDIAASAAYHLQGKSWKEIGELYDVHPDTARKSVYNRFRNIQRVSNYEMVPQGIFELAYKYRNEGMLWVDIVKKLKFNQRTLRKGVQRTIDPNFCRSKKQFKNIKTKNDA